MSGLVQADLDNRAKATKLKSLKVQGTSYLLGGVTFDTPVGTPAILNAYEVATAVPGFQVPISSGNAAAGNLVAATISMIGNRVTLYVPAMTVAAGASPVATYTIAAVIPARFRPAVTKTMIGYYTDQATTQAAAITITAAGDFNWSRITGAVFTASQSQVLAIQDFTWTV